MNKKIIQVENLSKTFTSFKKREGFMNSLRDFFKREKIEKRAVDSISFEIEEGEFVGFIGPNGAGKTTTLKMLTGILTPSSGEARVLNHIPSKRENAFKKQFALVMGQKSQLWWDLPPADSYELFRHIYQIPEAEYKKQLHFLIELLDLSEVMHIQTRKLSLGQRMKAELAGALLHKPKVLFLDEPTIGLDVIAQKTIRDFLKKYNEESKATIVLTSHYMEDIRRLCNRVIIIDHGKILYDGNYNELNKKFAQHKRVDLYFSHEVNKKDVQKFGIVDEWKGDQARVNIPRENAGQIVAQMLKELPIEDLSIHEQDMEEIVSDIFSKHYV